MSTEGSGAVVVVGLALGGVGLAVGMAAAGLGILAVRGAMWCGEKLEENYRNACRRWADQAERARQENLAHVSDLPDFTTTQLERSAMYSAYLTVHAPVSQPASTAQDITSALAQARSALLDGKALARMQEGKERAFWSERLRAEIAAARGTLPKAVIASAESALQSTVPQMQLAVSRLQQAWQAASDAQAQQQYALWQAKQAVQIADAQLQALQVLLYDNKRELQYQSQVRAVTHKIEQARMLLATDAAQALQDATDAQQAIREMIRAMSAEAQRAWEAARLKVVALQGKLDALATMLEEAKILKLLETGELKTLKQKHGEVEQACQKLLATQKLMEEQQLQQLEASVEQLKKEVFRATKSGQQTRIAHVIADTLVEQGFKPDEDTFPVQVDGQDLRVEAIRIPSGKDGKRDDKVVTFNVSPEGEVSFDFYGYVGDSCLGDARKIFNALRTKGIFILDDDALDELKNVPVEQITSGMLKEERFALHLVENKVQAEIAQRLMQVLHNMQYSNIQAKAVGGYLEMDAFNGSIGYHIVLPPEGEAQVYKDQQDVSADSGDPVVAELQQTSVEETEVPQQKKPEKTRAATKRPAAGRKQRMLGN